MTKQNISTAQMVEWLGEIIGIYTQVENMSSEPWRKSWQYKRIMCEAIRAKLLAAEGMANFAEHKYDCNWCESQRNSADIEPCNCGYEQALTAYREAGE